MRHTIAGRVCLDCGRPLETGETCNCRQPVRGVTRDGLRGALPVLPAPQQLPRPLLSHLRRAEDGILRLRPAQRAIPALLLRAV